MKISIRSIVFTGLFAALACIATLSIPIILPVPGYYHAGDSMVYLSGIILGPTIGGLAAGIGSAFADIFAGYAMYALPTLFIKGIDAFVAGLIFKTLVKKNSTILTKLTALAIAVVAGGFVMVSGYFLTEVAFTSVAGAMGTIVPNIVQVTVGGVIAALIYSVLESSGVTKLVTKRAL